MFSFNQRWLLFSIHLLSCFLTVEREVINSYFIRFANRSQYHVVNWLDYILFYSRNCCPELLLIILAKEPLRLDGEVPAAKNWCCCCCIGDKISELLKLFIGLILCWDGCCCGGLILIEPTEREHKLAPALICIKYKPLSHS